MSTTVTEYAELNALRDDTRASLFLASLASVLMVVGTGCEVHIFNIVLSPPKLFPSPPSKGSAQVRHTGPDRRTRGVKFNPRF